MVKNISFSLCAGDFNITTVNTPEVFGRMLEFRSQIFNYRDEIDVDQFDSLFDHIVVIDQTTNDIVATVRLKSVQAVEESYTATEFHIEDLIAGTGNKIELGRLCISEQFRKTYIFSLLWKGIFNYLEVCPADYLFGCTSLFETETIYQQLEFLKANGYCPPNLFNIRPVHDDITNTLPRHGRIIHSSRDLEPILHCYANFNVAFCNQLFHDEKFNCYDLFTLLDLKLFDQQHKDRLLR